MPKAPLRTLIAEGSGARQDGFRLWPAGPEWILEKEKLGELALGIPDGEVLKILGASATATKPILMEATGEWLIERSTAACVPWLRAGCSRHVFHGPSPLGRGPRIWLSAVGCRGLHGTMRMFMALLLPGVLAAADEASPAALRFDGEPEVVSEGHQFAEGMAFDVEGNFFFTDVPKGKLFRIDGKSGAKPIVVPPFGERPRCNYVRLSPDGRWLYAAFAKDIVRLRVGELVK